jgi:hypothetical protein
LGCCPLTTESVSIRQLAATTAFTLSGANIDEQKHRGEINRDGTISITYLTGDGLAKDFTKPQEVVKSASETGSTGKSGPCFIATAVYGDSLAPDVVLFRDYRDQELSRKKHGPGIIHLYETFSPPLADMIRGHERVKRYIRRFVLGPLAGIMRRFRQG